MAQIENDEYLVTKTLRVEGNLELGTAKPVTGTSYHDLTMFYNAPALIGADWVTSTSGAYTLTLNKTTKSINFPLSGLKEGDILKSYRVLGGCEAISGSITTIDACLWKLTKAAAADATATSCGAITQVAASVDTSIDSEKDVTDLTVTDDYQYFVGVKGSTANTDECGAMISGVEVDIKRIV